MVFFVRITVNQSHLRPICKSTKFNPKIQRTIYLINFQQLRLHVPDFIRTVVHKYNEIFRNHQLFPAFSFIKRKKMSLQNTDKCLNRSHFTLNLIKN